MDEKKKLIAWLNDAYSIEQSLVQSLEMQIPLMEEHPDVQARIEEHLEETRAHKQMVEKAIESLGGSPSAAKAVMGTVSGFISGIMNVGKDQAVRNLAADYAMEHLEIATYRAVSAAAEVLEEEKIVAMCTEILAEEEQMAAWLHDQVPHIAKTHLLV